jgi:hypothetical protein
MVLPIVANLTAEDHDLNTFQFALYQEAFM